MYLIIKIVENGFIIECWREGRRTPVSTTISSTIGTTIKAIIPRLTSGLKLQCLQYVFPTGTLLTTGTYIEEKLKQKED